MRDESAIALAIEMFDGQLERFLLVRSLVGISTGQRHVEAQRNRIARGGIAEFLRPGRFGQDKGRYPRGENTGHARLDDAAAADSAFHFAH
jgi:hypothetical protein